MARMTPEQFAGCVQNLIETECKEVCSATLAEDTCCMKRLAGRSIETAWHAWEALTIRTASLYAETKV